MISYASIDDLVRQFGEQEAIELSDRVRDGVISNEVLQIALDDATHEINGYLGRYSLPFKKTPPILKRHCVNIARFFLCEASYLMMSEKIVDAYERAIRFLERVANGAIPLLDDETEQVAEADDLIMFPNQSPAVFSRQNR